MAEECDATPMHEFYLPRKNKKKREKKHEYHTDIVFLFCHFSFFFFWVFSCSFRLIIICK